MFACVSSRVHLSTSNDWMINALEMMHYKIPRKNEVQGSETQSFCHSSDFPQLTQIPLKKKYVILLYIYKNQ